MHDRTRYVIVLGVMATSALAGAARAAEVVESFDTAASASAHGWVATGGSSPTLGFSNTSEAGGTPGEARALLAATPGTGSYLDTTLGGTVTSAQAMNFQGKLDILQNMPGAQAVSIGFGSARRSDFLGLLFFSQAGAPPWSILGQVQQSSAGTVTQFARAGSGPTRLVAPGDRTFSFSYDPAGGNGNGRIVASVSGAGDPVTIDLSPGDRASFDAARLDAFGIRYTQLNPPSASLVTDYRLDDLTYTVLPEPQIAALAPAGLLCLRRRR